ncbi:hypothetical protein HYZ97_01500 [Candidatus Pacearchaeota archaeon]|nr:hypothetical protein [Candidatus Pacearchaeota archaeon]
MVKQKHAVHREYVYKRRVILVLSILIALMIYFFKNASFLLRAATTIEFLILFYLIDHFLDIRFRPHHYGFVLLIGVFSLLLSPLYYVYPNYDKIQHFVQPMLFCSIIYFMVNKLKLEMRWKLIFTFFVTLGILGLFEISEYTLDHFFDLKLQGVYLRDLHGFEKFNLITDPLDDTIFDLILGVLGSGLYAIILGIWYRAQGKHILKR